MKISWKEVLAIAVLAIISTIAGLFLTSVQYLQCCKGSGDIPCIGCAIARARGWPFPYFLPKDLLSQGILLPSLVADTLLYFAIIGLIWFSFKFIYKKLNRS